MGAAEANLEELRTLVLEHGLPRTDLTLFGVRCPYCGKSDRIRPLEPPDELGGSLLAEARASYARLWAELAGQRRLGVCGFCSIPVALTAGAATLLTE